MKLYSGVDNSPVENVYGLGIQEIRKNPSLGDLSVAVRNQVPYGNPDMLFNIYIQNGVVRTATRKYPDYFHKNWTDEFDVGTGTACAIAFDGEWKLYDYKWRYTTYKYPYILWVDNDGKLFSQLWDDTDTKFELSQDVLKVKAIRGWKNNSFLDRDHGLVAAYIKTDGKVYYRNYAYQLTGEFAWENERLLEEFTGTAVNLNLFITNDYRTGFVVEDNTSNVHLFITDRNWAGMALAPEKIYAYPYEIKLDLIELDHEKVEHDINLKAYPYAIELALLFGNTDNTLLSAENIPMTKLDEQGQEYDDWGWIIEIKVQNPIPVLVLGNITVTDVTKSTPIQMASVTKVDDFTFRLMASDVIENGFNNVLGDIKIDMVNVKNEAGYDYDNMSKTFTPVNLDPEFIPIPEVDEVWNE